MTEMQVLVLSANGNQVVPLSCLEDICGLTTEDVDFILDQWADGNRSAWIGEVEYRESTGNPYDAAPAMDDREAELDDMARA